MGEDTSKLSREKSKRGGASHIDMGQVESGWDKWMRGGASLKQGEANRNGLGPFQMGWEMLKKG